MVFLSGIRGLGRSFRTRGAKLSMAEWPRESEGVAMGEDKFQHMTKLRAEYDAHFPESERTRSAYVQVFP